MNTPPPSTTNPPSGVQAPDGYTTDTGQMSSAGRNISNKAEDAKRDVDEVQPTELQATEFGEHADHQEFHADYAEGIVELGNAAVAMCDNLTAFAGQLGGAGTSYANTESGAQTTVTTPGSGV